MRLPALAAVWLLLCVPLQAAAQVFEDHGDSDPPYRVFLPPGLDPARPVPLVVMLHGCNQDAQAFAEVTGMNDLAAAEGFVVLYPEQRAHPTECWRWYEPGQQQRDQGEPAAIAGLVAEVGQRPDLTIDPGRVYVAGLSAGAAMAAILGATYPEVFAAAGLAAGIPYGAAEGCLSAFNAMQRIHARLPGSWADYSQAYWTCVFAGEFNPLLSPLPTPDALGEKAHDAMGPRARILPVVVFQGSADERVFPENGDDMIGQWAQANDLASDGLDNDDIDAVAERATPGGRPGGHPYSEKVYEDGQGAVVMVFYEIEGMAHAWPGGAPGLSFSDPEGPEASRLIWEFFAAHPKPATP
ncbi:MAG: PHB depolymerase family esterase [Kiloniellales bacterium]|nr:PHB depolymerase family esterase [Kiloniellales bacterium]